MLLVQSDTRLKTYLSQLLLHAHNAHLPAVPLNVLGHLDGLFIKKVLPVRDEAPFTLPLGLHSITTHNFVLWPVPLV